MMDRIREGMNGPMAWVLLALVFIAFVFTGAGSFFTPDSGNTIAKVDGAEISRAEFEQAYQSGRQRYGEMYAQIFNTEEKEQDFRRMVMQSLVARTALQESLSDLNMHISAKQLREQIQGMEVFHRDGKYDEATLEMKLLGAQYTKEQFRAQMEKDMLGMQILRGLSDTAFTLPNESERFQKLQGEKLSGKFVRLSSSHFMPTEAPADAEIDTYYQANLAKFAVPEQFNLQYVEIDGEAMRSQVTVSDEELQAHYDSHKDQYTGAERRTVAHILFTVEDAGKDAEVKAKAESVLAEVNAGGDFATLVAQHSEDSLSKDKGGQLDPIEKGFQDPGFDEAVFALAAPGTVSSLVRSEFGYHIIKLLNVTGGDVQPFEDVKASIHDTIASTKVYDQFAKKESLLTEKGFETPDSLVEVAAALGVELKETGIFSRGAPLSIAREAGVLEAATTDEVLSQRRNSAVVRLGDLKAVMLRIKDYKAASHRALDEVKGQITAEINNNKARENTLAFGTELMAKVVAGEDVVSLLTEKNSNWESFDSITRQSPAPEPMVREQLFKIARPNDKATVHGSVLTDGSYLLAELSRAQQPAAGELNAENTKASAEQLTRFNGEADYTAYIELLKKAATVTYKQEDLAPKPDAVAKL